VAQAVQKGLRTPQPSSAGDSPPTGPDLRARTTSIWAASMDQEEYGREVKHCEERLWDLEHEIYVRRVPVIVAYEGWDAAGKAGTSAARAQPRPPRLRSRADHRSERFGEEPPPPLAVLVACPKAGHIGPSSTGAGTAACWSSALEGFCRPDEWQRAVPEINEMEAQWTDFGAVLVKFWLHISKQEQLRRFRDRQRTSGKRGRSRAEDWRNRSKWDRVQAGRRRDARPDQHAKRAVDLHRGRVQMLRRGSRP